MKKYKIGLVVILSVLSMLVTLCFVPISASRLIPLVEETASKELGVKVHVEKLILRVGPYVKLKAPIMHIMYNDGVKFAQFDNVKFYIPLTSLCKNKPTLKLIYANKLTVRVESDNKEFVGLLDRLQAWDYKEIPSLRLQNYDISFANKLNSDKYRLSGHNMELDKVNKFKTLKLKTVGEFGINSKKHVSYDLNIVPKIPIVFNNNFDKLSEFIERIKELDFHSDVIADLTLYKSEQDVVQASGFINVDNISVLDASKKNPKSFIYLTLWGDKASVLSNIYTSQNKKVYIDGMINNSKKPVLDLKVKTDDISLSDLYNKLKIMTTFSHLKSLKSVDGSLNANFTVKGDLNKIRSNGYLKISNASIKGDGLSVEKINSDIDFSNNAINITNAVGYVNNAPIIAKGKIDKNIDIELLMNKVELKYLCPVSFGIKSGTASVVGKITGSFDNIIHNENLQLENVNIEKNDIKLGIDSVKYDTNKNNTAYFNNLTCQNPQTGLIKVPSFRLVVEGDSIKLPETNIFLPNSKIVSKAEVINYKNDINFNASLKGVLYSKDITAFNSTSTRYPIKLMLWGNKNIQNIHSQLLLENAAVLDEPTLLNFIAKLEKNILKIEDLSALSFNGQFSDDLKLNLKSNKKIVVNGSISDLKNPNLKSVRIFIPQQINLHICDTLAQLKGDLFVNGELKKPEIIGQLNLLNLVNPSTQLSLSNATLDFNKNNVVLNAPLVKLADSSVNLNALISTDLTDKLLVKNLSVKSKYVNTATLLMYKDIPVSKLLPIKINEGKFYSEKVSADIYGTPLYLTTFLSDIKLDNDILTLNNITAELLNGKMNGSLTYNLKDEYFKTDIMARGVSAAPIFDIVSTRKDSVSGTMDFDTKLTGELSSRTSLNGNIKFSVNNGRMSTLGKLEHLLYAQNVVADNMLRTSLSVVTKAITLKDTGLFKYLRGDIDLVNGIANLNLLQSQGPLMALYIKGQYNPVTDYAKMVVLGRLSDEVITGLGAFGDFSFNKLLVMLTGEDLKFGILPEDFDKLPQLPVKNTKEFRSVINGVIDKTSSVKSFNWVSYSQKTLKQKDVPMTNVAIPDFVNELPY